MRSIRVYLFGLVAICVGLAALAFALIVSQAAAVHREQAEADTQETARALSQAVDGELERALGVLAALGTSEAAVSHDWRTLDRQARAALPDRDAWIVVQDRSGRQLVNTRLPAGTPLPSASPPPEMWAALAAGRPHVCNLVHGLVEPNVVCVDTPIGIRPAQLAISVIFRPKVFASIITRENVGGGSIAALVDRSGKVIWRNVRPDRFVGKRATGRMLAALRSGAPSVVLETTSLEGVHMLSAFRRSPVSGWSVIVGTPIEQVQTASRQAIRQGSLLALAILLLGAALAALVGAKLASAVRTLVQAADRGTSPELEKRTGISEIDTVADALEASFAARAMSERHQQILIGELNHRVKNTLSIVQSLAHQTFRRSASPADAIAAFEARLQALAAAHNLLTSERWEAASMQQIIQIALAPFCDSHRCHLSGPDLQVPPQTAVSLALAIHELATNASKYGALSVAQGKIRVSWRLDGGRFHLSWQEEDGPPVRPPKADGFGMRLIKRSLAAELGGSVETDFAETGLRCRIAGNLAQAPAG